jgi:hypothetical protein
MYKRKDGIVKRDVAGEVFLVPITGKIANLKRIFVLNDVGGFVWDRLEKPMGIDDLVVAVVEAFDVKVDTARKDVEELLLSLAQSELVVQKA